MATTNVMNSTIGTLSIGGAVVGELTGVSLSITHSARNITNKTSQGWRELLEGLREWSASCSFMYIPGETTGWSDVFAAFTGRTQLTLRVGSAVVGDHFYEGTAYIASGTWDSPASEDNVVCDVSFDGTGPLVEDTVE